MKYMFTSKISGGRPWELEKAGLIKKAPEFSPFYRGSQTDAQ